MSQPLSRVEHIYIQAQAQGTYAAIPNTAHVANVAATDALKTRGSPTMNYAPTRVQSPDKQDNESIATLDNSIETRFTADYSLPLNVHGRSAIDVEPDCGPALLAAFGAGTASAGAKWEYTLSLGNYPLSFAMWRWIQEITGGDKVMQEMVYGCLVNQMRMAFGQDFATLDFSGPAFWGLSNDQWATASTDQKGDLTSDPWTTPGEPASQTYTGTLVKGFTGSATINGQNYTNLIKSGGIDCTFNRSYDMSIFGTNMGQTPTDDLYDIRPYITLIEDDSAAQTALRAAAIARTPIDITFVIGTVANSIWTWLCKNVILDYKPTRDDSQRRWQQTFRGKAHSTNASTRDELKLTLT